MAAVDSSNTKDLKMAKSHFAKKGIKMPWEKGYEIAPEKAKAQEKAREEVNAREISALDEAQAQLNSKISDNKKAKAEGDEAK